MRKILLIIKTMMMFSEQQKYHVSRFGFNICHNNNYSYIRFFLNLYSNFNLLRIWYSWTRNITPDSPSTDSIMPTTILSWIKFIAAERSDNPVKNPEIYGTSLIMICIILITSVIYQDYSFTSMLSYPANLHPILKKELIS